MGETRGGGVQRPLSSPSCCPMASELLGPVSSAWMLSGPMPQGHRGPWVISLRGEENPCGRGQGCRARPPGCVVFRRAQGLMFQVESREAAEALTGRASLSEAVSEFTSGARHPVREECAGRCEMSSALHGDRPTPRLPLPHAGFRDCLPQASDPPAPRAAWGVLQTQGQAILPLAPPPSSAQEARGWGAPGRSRCRLWMQAAPGPGSCGPADPPGRGPAEAQPAVRGPFREQALSLKCYPSSVQSHHSKNSGSAQSGLFICLFIQT